MERKNLRGKFFPGPILENCIVRWGRKRVYDVHYFSTTERGEPIPADACPVEAVAANLRIVSATGRGERAEVRGTYDLFCWFKFKQGRCLEKLEARDIPFRVLIPLHRLNKGSWPIFGEKGNSLSQVCAVSLNLQVVEALLEESGDQEGLTLRLKVVVGNDLVAFEQVLQPLFSAPVPLLLPKNSRQKEAVTPTAPAAVKGRITDQEGTPLPLVQITASDGERSFTTCTDFSGSFLLPLYPAAYELTVAKRGYIAQTSRLRLESGQIKKLNYRLETQPIPERFELKSQAVG